MPYNQMAGVLWDIMLWLGLVISAATLLAPRSPVHARPRADEPVSSVARVAADNAVWVDLENDSDADVELTSVVLSFYDRDRRLLLKQAVDCEDECVVGADAAASFGPIDGPAGWDTVEVTKVHYESLPPETASPGRPVAAVPRSARAGRPG